MNPYSQLGVDNTTLGYLSQAGIDPAASSSQMSAYPTYPNAAGVGSQNAGVLPTSPAPQQDKNAMPDPSARGLTPYSLLGDANYRQK